MLGVVATLEPVPLTCTRGVCSAEFTAFCLQERRASPARGTAYTAHDPRRIVLTGAKKGTGKTVRLAAADVLGIAAERGHSAVRMSVPVDVLRRHNLAALRVEVAEGVTLVAGAGGWRLAGPTPRRTSRSRPGPCGKRRRRSSMPAARRSRRRA